MSKVSSRAMFGIDLLVDKIGSECHIPGRSAAVQANLLCDGPFC
jgi:hypothetical protein